MRTTVTEMKPLLLSSLLELTEAQEGILNIALRITDEQGYPLLDLNDLQSVLMWLGKIVRMCPCGMGIFPWPQSRRSNDV